MSKQTITKAGITLIKDGEGAPGWRPSWEFTIDDRIFWATRDGSRGWELHARDREGIREADYLSTHRWLESNVVGCSVFPTLTALVDAVKAASAEDACDCVYTSRPDLTYAEVDAKGAKKEGPHHRPECPLFLAPEAEVEPDTLGDLADLIASEARFPTARDYRRAAELLSILGAERWAVQTLNARAGGVR